MSASRSRFLVCSFFLALLASSAALAANAPLCTEALNVCAREMRPLGVPLGSSFTVRIKDHFTATYECTMLNGKPHWAPIAQQGSCATQPAVILPAKYEADIPGNLG